MDNITSNIQRAFHSRIGWKTTIAVFLSIICIEIIILVPSYLRKEGDILRELEGIGHLAMTTAFDGVMGGDPHHVTTILSAHNVLGFQVFSGGKAIAAFGQPPVLPDTVVTGDETYRMRSTDGQFYDLGWFMSNTDNLGPVTVYARLDASHVKTELDAYLARIAGLVLIISLFVTLVTMIVLWFVVLRPLVSLQSRFADIQDGSSLTPIQDPAILRRDEVGDLYRAFDLMQDRVSQSIRSVERNNETLESLVAERTKELENVNSELAAQMEMSRLAENRFRTFTQSAADFYWEMDENVRFSFFSEGFENITSINPNILIGKTWKESGQQNVATDTWEKHLARTDRHEPFRDFVRRRRKNDGSYVWISLSGEPIFDQHGVFTGYRGTGRNITSLVESEKALREAKEVAETANHAKSHFLSSMSHELRTPLNAILGFAQLLQVNPKDPLSENQTLSVHHIERGGKHLLSLIDHVLDLAKIEAGRLSVSVENVNISLLLGECLEVASRLAESKRITIVGEIESLDGPIVRADRTRLNQVVLNLLSNAIKYNREDGNVIVSVSPRAGNTLRISVTDTGNGIPEHRHADVFQPFNRLGAEQTATEGTGIGLAISKQLVELMEGKIGFESSEHHGSTFWIEVPLADETSLETRLAGIDDKARKADWLSPPDQKATILYVEDNPANLALMETLMEHVDGATLISAHNAEIGLALATQEKPDLILMDINLPNMDGFEALRQLKGGERTAKIPVIAVSADAMPRTIERGLASGFFAYLTKPFQIDEVLETIKHVLDLRPGDDNG